MKKLTYLLIAVNISILGIMLALCSSLPNFLAVPFGAVSVVSFINFFAGGE